MKDPAKEILARKNWENVPAVQNKEVFEIDNMSALYQITTLPKH